VLLHKRLQGFFDIHGLGGQFARGIRMDLEQFYISHSSCSPSGAGAWMALHRRSRAMPANPIVSYIVQTPHTFFEIIEFARLREPRPEAPV
jgi:hypothetical protein